MIQKFTLNTRGKTDFIDMTQEIQKIIGSSGVKSGICFVLIPHTTAAVMLNEHADPDVTTDIDSVLNQLVPRHSDYRHVEGNSPAHVKAALIGSSQTIMIEDGEPVLGTWQGIFFCEFDGPRTRTILVKITEDKP